MNKFHIKNIMRISISGIIHLLIIISGVLLLLNLSKSFYNDFSTNYTDYKIFKGIEKYSNIITGSLISEENNVATYAYSVEGKNYTYLLNKSNVTSVDKEIDILYDVLEPENAITNIDIINTPNFYTETLKELGYLYFIYLGAFSLCGVLWYLVDRFKYSMKLWKCVLVR